MTRFAAICTRTTINIRHHQIKKMGRVELEILSNPTRQDTLTYLSAHIQHPEKGNMNNLNIIYNKDLRPASPCAMGSFRTFQEAERWNIKAKRSPPMT
jgi:hypothetical protein